MPKMKTNKGAAKRFQKTATGKLKRHHANKSHILTKKTPKRKRHLRGADLVKKSDVQRMKRLLGG